MKRALVALVVLVLTSGCLSPMVYNQSKQKVGLRKAIEADNNPAIKAFKLGEDGVGLGVNVLALDVLSEQPLKQLGAAIGDGLLIWAGYEGVKYIDNKLNNENNNSGGGGNSSDNSGRTDSTVVIVNGAYNDTRTGNTEETTTND